jgi:hypothetical protein
MGHEIRQLCEDKDFKISKPRASVERNRSTCAFCGVLAPHFRLVPGASEGNIDIFSNKPGWRSSRSDSHYDTNGIDELVIRDRKGTGLILLDVLTTESESLFLLLIDKERCLGLTVDTGSAPAIAKHVSGRCIKPASNLDRAKDWLNDCIHNHNHNQVRTAICPSRLVAVGTADGAEPIKIVDDSGADKKYLTWLASERPTQASGPPHQLSAPCELLPIMAPPIQPLLTSSEASIHLAILAINRS